MADGPAGIYTGNDDAVDQKKKSLISKLIFFSAILFCLFPFINPPLALLLGLVISQASGNPFAERSSIATKLLLQCSVIGLGFGMNLFDAAKAGRQGFTFTIVSVIGTLVTGILIGKIFGINKKISYLISVGTAICGGSAIVAVSPAIKAEPQQMSVSLATVFVLNSIALLVFPLIGHFFYLSPSQFGLWAAISIHDMSSVVGAAHTFGMDALQVATTVKLERALWIIPVSLFTTLVFKGRNNWTQVPWFILFYIGAMAVNTFVQSLNTIGIAILPFAKKGLTVTLFLIGSGLSREALRTVGFKPFILGLILWVLISVCSLLVILYQT